MRFAVSWPESRRHDWTVYAKPPFGGPEQALKYLARYTHRIALSNPRLLAVDRSSVTFSWKDYAHDHRLRTLQLPTDEFARRFLLHVLPHHFVRIRCYGFLANARRAADLERCRVLLADRAPDRNGPPPLPTAPAADLPPSGNPPLHATCPRCGTGTLTRLPLSLHDTS